MIAFEAELALRLGKLDAQGQGRRLSLPQGRDFSSNDYLSLTHDPDFGWRLQERLARFLAAAADPSSATGVGAAASRLLRGHTQEHEELEARLAAFKGSERALLFPTGYQANLGVLTALIGPQDRAITDALNHASLIDGLRLSRCTKVIVPHLDLAAIKQALATPFATGRTFLVTESLFSMDGDLAPLDRYAQMCAHYGAELIVDDAHATGLYGARGSGWVEHCGVTEQALAVVSTCSKAVGLTGAFVTGSAVLIDYLVNRCRPFIFTTAQPPLFLLAIDAALEFLTAHPERRFAVHANAAWLRQELGVHGIDTGVGTGPIVPVRIGDQHRALMIAASLQASGFDVRAIRPPTVPAGTERLRISVHAGHSRDELSQLAAELAKRLALL